LVKIIHLQKTEALHTMIHRNIQAEFDDCYKTIPVQTMGMDFMNTNDLTELAYQILESANSTDCLPLQNNKPFHETYAYATNPFDCESTNSNLNILIAEDEEINYYYLVELLEETKANIFHARNGKEAVQLCRSHPEINIILMDIKMPLMNGYEATQQIREFRNDLIIIAQTAYAYSENKEKALTAGCTDFVTKPINREKLIHLINSYIQ